MCEQHKKSMGYGVGKNAKQKMKKCEIFENIQNYMDYEVVAGYK